MEFCAERKNDESIFSVLEPSGSYFVIQDNTKDKNIFGKESIIDSIILDCISLGFNPKKQKIILVGQANNFYCYGLKPKDLSVALCLKATEENLDKAKQIFECFIF